jgi:hypothetical protein
MTKYVDDKKGVADSILGEVGQTSAGVKIIC